MSDAFEDISAEPNLFDIPPSDRMICAKEIAPPAAQLLGINIVGGYLPTIFVTNDQMPIGRISIEAGRGAFIFIDNDECSPTVSASVRMLGNNSRIAFLGLRNRILNIQMIFMRNHDQTFVWGAGSSAVEATFEVEGAGSRMIIGDDCMLSMGVFVRNYDMHTIFDVESGAVQNRAPVNMTIERHVWVAQNSVIMGVERLGAGSIVGVGSLVKDNVPPLSIVAGTPARLIRSGVSWSREVQWAVPADVEWSRTLLRN